MRRTEQLVAREADQVDAALHRVEDERLVSQQGLQRLASGALEQARTEVEAGDDVARPADVRQIARAHLLDETRDAEVARVHLDEQARALVDRALVVRAPRAVRRAHLDQLRVRARHDVGHAERAADLDQLAARHDRLAPAGEGLEHEQHRAGAVVDADAGFRAGDAHEEIAQVVVALVALVRLAVDLEDAVAASRLGHRRRHLGMHGRAAETRVEHDAGRVDAAHDAALLLAAHALGDRREEISARQALLDHARGELLGADFGAPGLDHLRRKALHQLASGFFDERRRARIAHHFVDRGQEAESGLGVGRGASHGRPLSLLARCETRKSSVAVLPGRFTASRRRSGA